jgi:hypothetical protein
MKQKLQRKKPVKGQSEMKASTQSVGPESQAPVAEAKPEPQAVPTVVHGPPPPELVAAAARGEPSIRFVEEYKEAITILRDEKGFTFREIAEWLGEEFHIEADHNAVWRVYTRVFLRAS